MTIPEVLANLKAHNEWDIADYPLCEAEGKTIISALEKLLRVEAAIAAMEDDGK